MMSGFRSDTVFMRSHLAGRAEGSRVCLNHAVLCGSIEFAHPPSLPPGMRVRHGVGTLCGVSANAVIAPLSEPFSAGQTVRVRQGLGTLCGVSANAVLQNREFPLARH